MTHQDSRRPATQLEPTLSFAGDAEISEKLVRLLDDYFAEVKAGRVPDRQRLLAENPELASQLEACLGGLDILAGERSPLASRDELGGFRIIREIGQGGMGTVYEAEEVALGRRVALKVLRFGALADSSAAQRFQREAATVAALHHTNIVPIYSVGSEKGVSYFAMQFIAGRSLAEVLRGGAVECQHTARWALQAAEALDHAHRRGVVHRDVKPSNLLLDSDDRIWLTDFGLARRLDDVTMSVTGALLGTPRYMSPEQASATGQRQIDARTDIFSLGATLYELVTGTPAFDGNNTAQVIHQILTADPEPPRELRADLQRDLQTIVLKCLAKDPAGRYQTARELADDLRAFLEGRAIRARRPSLAVEAVRWVRRQRRSVVLTLASIAATLIVTLGAIFGSQLYQNWQRSFLSFTTDTPPLVVEVRDENDRLVAGPTTVPTQQPLELPSGQYRLNVQGRGRFSETLRVTAPRGQQLTYPLSLDDQTLWPAIDVGGFAGLAPAGNDHTMSPVVFDERGVSLVNGSDGSRRWTRTLVDAKRSLIEQAPHLVWPWHSTFSWSGVDKFDTRPLILGQKLDIDRDGHGDVVIAARHQAWVLALSGSNGQVLWFAGLGADLDRPAARPQPGGRHSPTSAVCGTPRAIGDVDGDGVPDLLATWIDRDSGQADTIKRRVETLSGATGKTVWRYELEESWFDGGAATPYAFRWFANAMESTQAGGGDILPQETAAYRLSPRWVERGGEFIEAPEAARLANVDGTPRVVLTAGKRLVVLSADEGKPVGPGELPFRPARPPQWVDVDGDGDDEMIALEEAANPARRIPDARLVVWSTADRRVRWEQKLEASLVRRPTWNSDDPQWPLVADLDSDGRSEIVLPNGSSLRQPGSLLSWGELEVRDAATGETKWRKRIMCLDRQIDQFAIGPDIDADGFHEVFVASLWGEQFEAYIEALSGRDGNTLWRTSYQPTQLRVTGGEYFVAAPRLWNGAPDGFPCLLVVLHRDEHGRTEDSSLLLSARTGELIRTAEGIGEVQFGDLDGDGSEDLFTFAAKDSQRRDYGGKLEAITGIRREEWRWLGPQWQVADDFDADGVHDLVQSNAEGEIRSLSGRSGEVLWTGRVKGLRLTSARLQPASGSALQHIATTRSKAHTQVPGDLDSDSAPDLFARAHHSSSNNAFKPLHAVSGKSGKLLWESDIEATSVRGVPLLESCDLDADGKPEVVFAAAMDWTTDGKPEQNPVRGRLWLTVLSGQNGRLKWAVPLSNESRDASGGDHHHYDQVQFELAVGDFNSDGVLDIVVPAENADDPTQMQLRAVSGSNGATLWKAALVTSNGDPQPFRSVPPVLVADIDNDGAPEAYVLQFQDETAAQGVIRRLARLDALAPGGAIKWSWQTTVDKNCGRNINSEDQFAARPRPMLLHRAGGDGLIALNFWGTPGEVAIVDGRGQLVTRINVAGSAEEFRIWTDDLNADGNGDVLLMEKQVIKAFEPHSGKALWQAMPHSAWQSALLDVIPSDGDRPADVVVFSGAPQFKVQGFDGASGKLRWVCPGPKPKRGTSWVVNLRSSVLNTVVENDAPLVRFEFDSCTACRSASLAFDARETLKRSMAKLPEADFDPRLLRPLPWRPRMNEQERQAMPAFMAWALFYSLSLLAVPLFLAVRLVRRRTWGFGTLALLPVAAALATTALLIDGSDNYFTSPLAKLGIGVAGLPLIVGIFVLSRWTYRRRWGVIAAWVFVSIVVAVAGGWWAIHAVSDRMAEGQRFSHEGWYWIWIIAVYWTMWLACLWLPLAAIVRRLWTVYAGRRAAV